MEDVYLDGSRLVFVLLESLFVMASTKNIETLISRFHFSFTATSPCRVYAKARDVADSR
jgi:hypothetical protein